MLTGVFQLIRIILAQHADLLRGDYVISVFT